MTSNGPSLLKYSLEECLHLASRFRGAGDLSSALAWAGRALEENPQDDRPRYLLATLHADAGLLARAIREYDELLQRKPDWLPVRFNLGVLWLNARRTAEAREQFTVVAESKDPALALYAQAMLAVIANDLSKAREKIEAGMAVDVRPTEVSAWIKAFAASLPTTGGPAPADQDHAPLLRGYNQAPKM